MANDPYIPNPVGELARLLGEAGMRVTLDPKRTITDPCFVCGETAHPRDLMTVGYRTPNHRHYETSGAAIKRPVCGACAPHVSWSSDIKYVRTTDPQGVVPAEAFDGNPAYVDAFMKISGWIFTDEADVTDPPEGWTCLSEGWGRSSIYHHAKTAMIAVFDWSLGGTLVEAHVFVGVFPVSFGEE